MVLSVVSQPGMLYEALPVSHFHLCCAVLIYFRKSECQKPVLFGCLSRVNVDFLRKKDGAGEIAPIELAVEIVIAAYLFLFDTSAADIYHVAGNRNIKIFRSYTCDKRFNDDFVWILVYVYGELS